MAVSSCFPVVVVVVVVASVDCSSLADSDYRYAPAEGLLQSAQQRPGESLLREEKCRCQTWNDVDSEWLCLDEIDLISGGDNVIAVGGVGGSSAPGSAGEASYV
eukprot:TRINITY_DN12897_c0_g1_i3.p2 TRINITY_DN12897_c0_g1~~TRINITY_DN12897_c0_g1_i3.p2  ORF type:complete len:104 (-),score=24.47 TRINITY_DN12897_c0_g1_i3:156-467(-)